MTHPYASVLKAGITGNDDVEAVGQRLANGGEGFASHHQRLGLGHTLEEFEILGQVPGQFVVDTNNAVTRYGGDHGDGYQGGVQAHTATSALMCGWGS